MQVHITGRHIELGETLKDHCEERAQGLTKHFHNIVDVQVNLAIEGHRHVAELVANASGLVARADGEGTDLYGAVDAAASKLTKQLDKYKGRLQKHRRRRQEASVNWGAIPPMQTTERVVEEDSLDEAPDDIMAEFMPKIVHKELKDLQPLSVDEAVMQMDLMHMNFYLFQNPQTKQINAVYRRGDGKVAWVEPQA